MKIGGPKGPGPIKPPSVEGPDQTPKQGPSRFDAVVADRQVKGKASEAVAGMDGVRDALRSIVEQLRTGELSANQGAEAVVKAVVRQRGQDLSPIQRERLEQTLLRAIAEDPLLASRARSVGTVRPAEE